MYSSCVSTTIHTDTYTYTHKNEHQTLTHTIVSQWNWNYFIKIYTTRCIYRFYISPIFCHPALFFSNLCDLRTEYTYLNCNNFYICFDKFWHDCTNTQTTQQIQPIFNYTRPLPLSIHAIFLFHTYTHTHSITCLIHLSFP